MLKTCLKLRRDLVSSFRYDLNLVRISARPAVLQDTASCPNFCPHQRAQNSFPDPQSLVPNSYCSDHDLRCLVPAHDGLKNLGSQNQHIHRSVKALFHCRRCFGAAGRHEQSLSLTNHATVRLSPEIPSCTRYIVAGPGSDSDELGTKPHAMFWYLRIQCVAG